MLNLPCEIMLCIKIFDFISQDELPHFDVPQILMADFWYNLYIFSHLLSSEAHKRNKTPEINLPSFHGVYIVDAHHGIAPLKKAFGQVEAYSPCGIMLRIKIFDFIPQGEAGSAGNQYFHEKNGICST